MTEDEKVRRALDIAAQKAFEVYGEVLSKLLTEAGFKVIPAITGHTHVHSAIMFEGGQAVAVRAQWDFTADPEILKRALDMAKEQGKFPSA
jgi:hypothetical protein